MIVLPTFRGALSGFSPLSLAPALWLSDTGSNPAQWADISGHGRHATQATGANQPAIVSNVINGRQVRRFDGTKFLRISDRTFLKNLSGCTIISVALQSTTTAGNRTIFSYLTSGVVNLAIQAFSGSTFLYGGRRVAADSGDFNNFGSALLNTPYIMSAILNWQAATKKAFASNGNSDNDVSFQTAGNSENFNSSADPGIGINAVGVEPMVGDIAEILVLPYAASDVQRQRVERFFSTKYAITMA